MSPIATEGSMSMNSISRSTSPISLKDRLHIGISQRKNSGTRQYFKLNQTISLEDSLQNSNKNFKAYKSFDQFTNKIP